MIARAHGTAAIAFLIGLSACAAHSRVDPNTAPVPDGGQRMSFPIATDDSTARRQLDFALGRTVCLVRTGKAQECQEQESDTTACVRDETAKVRAKYQPAFDSLPRLKLTSPSSINQAVRTTIPGAKPTTAVLDARRETACRIWAGKAECVAIRIGAVWLYLDGRDRAATDRYTLQVFLADKPCRGEPG